MEITALWEKLAPKTNTLEILKKDLQEGKVPELPYFIVDQKDAKQVIKTQLQNIDQNRMLTNMVRAQYGNGKTNLLKYLQLFFNGFTAGDIKVLYSRADVEQPDLILFLLKIIQDNYTDNLIDVVKATRGDIAVFTAHANNFDDNFSGIKEYVIELNKDGNNDEQIRKLIYLGTGRLYTKGHFNEFGLVQLTNFNRREIFVFLLNLLASQKKYIVFAIDEIEKIQEKSKLRFNQFLTSYRELIDLSNKIKGHYLLTSFTDASDSFTLDEVNAAFSTRIAPHVLKLPAISSVEDVKELLEYLNELFATNRTDLGKIVTQIGKRKHTRNRELLRHAIELLLLKDETLPIATLLQNYQLEPLYNSTKEKLSLEGSLRSLHQKFFDPLENYLMANFLLEDTSKIDRRDNQSFIDEVNNKVHMFIFNESTSSDNIQTKVNNLAHRFKKDIIIYSPVKLELSNSSIVVDEQNLNFQIVDYSPEELFILLNMFRDNFERQDEITKVITAYTQNNL